MKTPKTKRLNGYEVIWKDTFASGGWRSREKYEEVKPSICRSVGLLLCKDKQSLTLLQSESDYGNVSDGITIPIRCVMKIKRLR